MNFSMPGGGMGLPAEGGFTMPAGGDGSFTRRTEGESQRPGGSTAPGGNR